MHSKFLNKSLLQMDKDCIWHPFTQMKTAKFPKLIKKAKGAYLYSDDGISYLDAISSWWVNLHGHAHPYIVEKIKSQAEVLEHVIFADFTHEPAIDLSRCLLEILPQNMSKVFYSDNGSTAVEVALKIALQFWHNQNIKRTKIICFKGSYHGDTFGAMSAAGKNEFNTPFWKHLFDVVAIDPPIKTKEHLSIQQLQNVLKDEKAACFIYEPLVLGSGGMIIYSKEALEPLLKCCHEHEALTIADEVMTGFGRTGQLFASLDIQVKPDMICLSKGITGGFLPLGATVCTERIFNAFLDERFDKAFLHGHSYTANPIACTSALASLDLLLHEDSLKQRMMIENCHKKFVSKWKLHPKLKRCESIGTILAIEYQAESSSYFQPIRDRLYEYFLSEGILLRPLGNVLYILPPYCILEGELERIYGHIVFTLENNF